MTKQELFHMMVEFFRQDIDRPTSILASAVFLKASAKQRAGLESFHELGEKMQRMYYLRVMQEGWNILRGILRKEASVDINDAADVKELQCQEVRDILARHLQAGLDSR